MNKVTSIATKACLAYVPYFAEIQWQVAGSPGRDSFEPLQHAGNMGMGFAGFVATAAVSQVFYGKMNRRYLNSHAEVITDTELVASEQCLLDTDREDYKKTILPVSAALAAGSQVFSETLYSGTYDLLDVVYGVGASAVAMLAYTKIANSDFNDRQKHINQLGAQVT